MAQLGERYVGAARVTVLRVPHGLPMADEDEVGHGRAFRAVVGHGLLQPAAAGQRVDEVEVDGGAGGRYGRGRDGVPPRTRTMAPAASSSVGTRGGRGEHRHAEGASACSGSGRRARAHGAQLRPVAASGAAAGEGERAVDGGAEVVEVVEAEPFEQRHSQQAGVELLRPPAGSPRTKEAASGARNGKRSPPAPTSG